MTAQDALEKWRRLWEVLGADKIRMVNGANEKLGSYVRSSSSVIFAEVVSEDSAVSITPGKLYSVAECISYEEADVLQSLLLGE